MTGYVRNVRDIGFSSPTIHKNVLSLILHIFHLKFECNTRSNWLNQIGQLVRCCVTFQFGKSWRTGLRTFTRIVIVDEQ